ncbi:MAG TPA: ethylbenzene dehydrogenase-related protein [Tepidiformaceae bacterium]|jgi:complex iron-sulfur molybdoenzyme family reductase subunit gamma|nr:ethylbenzene dehydrogenase-related protein [Tepidiformaceae bacterium]
MVLDILKRRRVVLGIASVLALAAVLQFTNTNPAVSQTLYLTAYESAKDPGLDPTDGAWKDTVAVRVPLTAQRGSYAAGGSVATVSARALHYNDTLYVRVEWKDATKDESTTRVEDFSDAVALEFPAKTASTVPSVCMGQADAGVNIWHWRADSDAGLRDPVEIYAGASVDGYPSTDALFYTARAAGNPYANPDLGAVQTLVSQAFGQLTTSTVQDVAGKGVWENDTWAVVFARPYTSEGPEHAGFSAGARTDVAFAVWDGSQGERNGMKAASQFITLSIAGAKAPGGGGFSATWAILGAVMLVGLSALGIGLGVYGYREGKR